MRTTDLRDQLTDMLLEQIAQTKRVIRKKELIEMFRELHPKNYNDFVQQLQIPAKQEFLDEIIGETTLLLQLINWIDDSNLKALIRSASDSAILCQSIPTNRFPIILNELEENNILKIFNTSDYDQKMDIIHEIDGEKLTAVFSSLQEENDLVSFLQNLDETLYSLETSLEEEEELNFEKLPKEKQKVLQAIFRLDPEAIINIMQHQVHDRWLDYILENLLESTSAERIAERLTPSEIVNIMIDTEESEYFSAFVKVLLQESFNWSDVPYESQFKLLKKLLKEESDQIITSLFTPEQLAKLYTHADKDSKAFILNKVFPALIAENEQIYSSFYASLPDEQESGEFLKVMYEKARDDFQTAKELRKMLEGLSEKTILEQVFLTSLISEMSENGIVVAEGSTTDQMAKESIETEEAIAEELTADETAYDEEIPDSSVSEGVESTQ